VAAIGKAYPEVQTTTVRGSGGVFDVAIDGDFVFRKWEEDRFPRNDEILSAIAARQPKA
jgi:selT/selW/selH-like putative selenoprotein